MKSDLGLLVLAAVGFGIIGSNVYMRYRGYKIPGKVEVRCRRGHVFTTVWIEGGSLKAVRLGPLTRYQYCPVGRHWTIVHPIKQTKP
jgi:hypothetical protein